MYSNIMEKQFSTLTRIIYIMLCITLITACAYRDEGEIDYRRADIDTVEIENHQGKTLHIAKLEDKNKISDKNSKTSFSADDNLTISLSTAFIENYTEGFFSWVNDAFEGQLRPRGEIAVLAKVTPLDDLNTYGVSFSETAHRDAQVVFYSNDVVAGQFLNFNNMPIYGPNSKGVKDGVILEIWIMEIDISTPIVGALLDKMAASFSGSDAIGDQILEGLGGSLLGSVETSDTNFLYRALLVPPNSKNKFPAQAVLQVGSHVFIRAPKTSGVQDINWEELRLDENSGRLYECPKVTHKIKHRLGIKHDEQDIKHSHEVIHQTIEPLLSEGECKEYRRHNYLVVRIGKEKYGDKNVVNQVYSDFIDTVVNNKGYNQVTAGLAKLKRQPLIRQIYDFVDYQKNAEICEDEKVETINQFESYWDTYISHSFTQYLNNATTDTDISPVQLREIFTELSTAFNAVSPHTTQTAINFTLPDRVTDGTDAAVVERRKEAIVALIQRFDCPQPQQGQGTQASNALLKFITNAKVSFPDKLEKLKTLQKNLT